MSSELKNETLNWINLQGVTLEDAYLLEWLMNATESSASFTTRTGGERSSHAVVTLVKAEGEEAERQLQLWQTVKKWGHPNLLPIWGIGRAQIEGHDLIYSVTEMADEDLAGVLADRALEPAEAGEVLVSVVGALGHLHAYQLVHGDLSPQQIFAVGDAVKLSTRDVRRIGSTAARAGSAPRYLAPESTGENMTLAADVWCLGMTLLETFTQRDCRENCADAVAQLASPFREVAESCLRSEPEKRGTLGQVLDLYEGRLVTEEQTDVVTDMVPEAQEAKQMAVAAASEGGDSHTVNGGGRTLVTPEEMPLTITPATAIPVASTYESSGPMSSAAPHFVAETKSPPTEFRRQAAAPSAVDQSAETIGRAKRRAWILVAIAFAILLGVVWLLRPSSTRRTVGSHSSSPVPAKHNVNGGQTMTLPAAGQGGAAGSAASTPKTASPAGTVAQQSQAAPVSPRQTAVSSAASNGPIWRVVLYTYNRAADAEQRVSRIEKNHGGLNPAVFTPNGEGKAPFLVVIGGAMDYNQAVQLRKKALRSGLPRDAYLQNYNR